MRAIGFLTPDGPEVLHELDVPEPEAPDGHVKIAIRAATVNPSDASLRSGLTLARGEIEPSKISGAKLL